MSRKSDKKYLNINKKRKESSREKSEGFESQDLPRKQQLEEAFDSMKIDKQLIVLDDDHGLTKKDKKENERERGRSRLGGEETKESKGKNGTRTTSGFAINFTEKKHSINKEKHGRASAKMIKKVSERSSVKRMYSTNPDGNQATSSIPIKAKVKGQSSDQNLSKQSPHVNNRTIDDLKIKSEKNNNNGTGKFKIPDDDETSRKMNARSRLSENKRIDSAMEYLEQKTNAPHVRAESPVVKFIKRENQSSPQQTPRASVPSSCAMQPLVPSNNPQKKYEGSFSASDILINKIKVDEEKKMSKCSETMKDKLPGDNSKADMMLNYVMTDEKEKANCLISDMKVAGKKNSSKTYAIRAREEQRRLENRRLAKAFAKLGAHFVRTARRMGYLEDTTGDSSTDDSEDFSVHSTDCSCSSCTSWSDTSYSSSCDSDTSDSPSSSESTSETD